MAPSSPRPDLLNRSQIVNIRSDLVADRASWVAVAAPETALVT
jgi:hypothetical protein